MGDLKEQTLLELGFSQNEVKIYIALLEKGLSTPTDIAKKTKLYRTNIYDALDRLMKKGLVSYVINEDKKFFDVSDPKNLLVLLKEKELNLQKVMPEFELAKQLSKSGSQSCIFEGVQAFQKLLDSFLKYNEPILVFGIPKNAPELMKTFIPHFHQRRIAKKIVMKHIYNHNAQERINFLNKMPLTEAKYLPSQYDSKVSTNICGDEVVLALWTDPVFVIQINNKHIADAYRNYFNILWQDSVM